MSDYIENTNYIGNATTANRGQESVFMVNQSTELDKIAEKLEPFALQEVCPTFLEKESYNKVRFNDMLSAICLLFNLLKTSGNKPVYLVKDSFEWETASGYYFFVGTEDEISKKLHILLEDSGNRKKNARWH